MSISNKANPTMQSDCPPMAPKSSKKNFSHFAAKVAAWCGRPWAFALAVAMVLTWAATGPFFNYSENWQIVINTSTTIITFLMVFVIQSSQNRESQALHLKLNELIRTLQGARNEMVAAEEFDEDRLNDLKDTFHGMAEEAESAGGKRSASSSGAAQESLKRAKIDV